MIEASKGVYINGVHSYYNAFNQGSFIAGSSIPAHNNHESTWGPTPGVDGVQHKYVPQMMYIRQLVNTISSVKLSTIVNYGVIMRLETLDGNTDAFTLVLDDSSSINNDGVITNLPEWIVGPHG